MVISCLPGAVVKVLGSANALVKVTLWLPQADIRSVYRFQEGDVPSGFGTIDDYINLVMYYSSVLRVPHYKKRSHHHYRRQDKKPLKEPNRRIGDGMQTPRGDGHASQCFAQKKSSRLIQSPPRITHRFLTQRLSGEPYNYVALKTSRQIPI
jgi:hypothetical protein